MPLVPRTMTSDNKVKGRHDKRDFVYIAQEHEYRCPAGERFPYRMPSIEEGMKIGTY